MNKYEENLELMMDSGIDPIFFLDTQYEDKNKYEDIALAEIARSYNYAMYIKKLLYISDEEFKAEVEKQLQETYSKLMKGNIE